MEHVIDCLTMFTNTKIKDAVASQSKILLESPFSPK